MHPDQKSGSILTRKQEASWPRSRNDPDQGRALHERDQEKNRKRQGALRRRKHYWWANWVSNCIIDQSSTTSGTNLYTWTLRKVDQNYLKSFVMKYWRRMKKKITNREALRSVGEERTLLSTILKRKGNWIGSILRKNVFYTMRSKVK